jgi:hypothetical protein
MEEVRKNPSSLIKNTFIKAIDSLSKDYKGSSLTDIFITVDKESGEVSFYDDEENKVAEIVVFDWVGKTEELGDEQVTSVLREVTMQLEAEETFSSLDLYKPFSVNYSDDGFEVIEELLLISDDSAIKSGNDLMDKFDREFDDFLDKLLKE